MRQAITETTDFQTAFDKYPATCFLRVLPSISSGLISSVRTHWHSAMRTQFTATGDFVLKNVGSVVQDIRRAFGNALGETMPKISVMKMVK